MKQDETALRGVGNLNSVPLPVLFTCPHGGRVEFSPVRDDSNVSCCPREFRIKSDNNTIEVTEGIALNIFRLSTRDVYRTIAISDRSFVDFNRGPECAFSSKDDFAKHLYDVYHDEISRTIVKMHGQNDQGLCFLFDIHSTDDTDAEIFFGTDARSNPHKSTICGLLERNPNALWDENTGLIKLLQNKGYSTIPRNINDSEHPSFDGGLTVKKYGDCDLNSRVEAIQCEITADLRDRTKRLKFTADMAECILNFVRPYISQI